MEILQIRVEECMDSYPFHLYYCNSLLSMKKAPVLSLSLSCLPDNSDVKKVSPADNRVVDEVTNVS